jgi:DNA polymerase-3 subunit chi
MTRVDFYLLDNAAPAGKSQLACRLAEKAYGLGHKVYVQATDENEARQLDDLLWTFSQGSFIPHALADGTARAPDEAPVLIGHGEPPPDWHDVLITLAPAVTTWFSRFERVAEIVGGDEADKTRGRERYRFYRDRGYTLETHPL